VSRSQRLSRLEGALTATPTERGSYCPQCSGITIEDALRDDAILGDAASDHCGMCGELTLAGWLRAEDKTR
jgi:hypothetical protein